MVNHPTSSASQSNLTQSHTHSKQVPTITTYEPHLPSGPGHFIGFPIPANHPLQSPFSQPMIDPSSFGLHPRQFAPPGTVQEEELLLWQQQQQMLQKQLEVAQLQLIPQQHLQPPPAGSSSNEQQHSLVFQYPSPEEMSRVRTGGPIPAQIAAQEGIPHHFHPLVAAAGGTPSVIMESRPPHHEELRQAPPHVSIPIQANFVNLDALQQQQLILAQHQQQQAAVQQQQTHLMITPEQFAEMQRQYIIALQELQKNPNAINNPNIQAIISQYQQIEPYVVQHQQQQMQQEALMQQELLKQQQQKFVTQSANRPGVIINLQGK